VPIAAVDLSTNATNIAEMPVDTGGDANHLQRQRLRGIAHA
jgi:hypothetical protein